MTHVYIPGVFDPALFDKLWNGLEWEKRPDAPRRECWMNDFGRPYTYGKGKGVRTYEARPWNEDVLAIRDTLSGLYSHLEGCFANGYPTSRDWLGWHADDDPGIDHDKPIVVVSFGQERAIRTKLIEPPDDSDPAQHTKTFMLGSGSVFVMPPGSQFTHLHCIPKVGHDVGPRLSLTYRGLCSLKSQ